MDETGRHLRLLTETIAAVNSTLDLEEVLSLVASKVADALDADACFVYLYDEHGDESCCARRTDTRRGDDGRPRMRPGEGITGTAAEDARAGDDPRAGAPGRALQGVSEPAGGRVRVDPGGADPGADEAGRGCERAHAGTTGVLGGRDRPAARDRGSGRADDRAREAVRRRAGAGLGSSRRWRGSRRLSRSRSTSRNRSRRSSRPRSRRSGRQARPSCSRTARSRSPRGGPASTRSACRCAGSAGRSVSSSATATSRSPSRRRHCSRRSRTTQPSRCSTDGPSCVASSRKRSTTGSRTTCRPSRPCSGCRRGPTASTRVRRWRTR